ncbi:MAG: hypothetical protein KAT04_06580 [Methylococcales bacterium]|nr:hypothetical protein [Methylococcales bacterium]
MMKNIILKTILLLILTTSNVVAEVSIIETWECAADKYSSNVLATAYVYKGRVAGHIKVAGVTHDAQFRTRGFDRRWNFGLNDDDKYYYAFVINPSGTAFYYDFTSAEKNVTPSINMICKMK